MDVVLPLPEYDDQPRPLSARVHTLRGATIGFLDGWGDRGADGVYRMYPVMQLIADAAVREWGVAEVRWIKKARAGSLAAPHQIDAMAECDAVIAGTCLSGGCTNGAVGDAAELERRGIPTVTLCQDNFEALAESIASSLGFPSLRLFVYPRPLAGNLGDGTRDLMESRLGELADALASEGGRS